MSNSIRNRKKPTIRRLFLYYLYSVMFSLFDLLPSEAAQESLSAIFIVFTIEISMGMGKQRYFEVLQVFKTHRLFGIQSFSMQLLHSLNQLLSLLHFGCCYRRFIWPIEFSHKSMLVIEELYGHCCFKYLFQFDSSHS